MREGAGRIGYNALMRWLVILVLWLPAMAYAAEGKEGAQGKARVAVFPIAGEAAESLRERAGFALRAKLDRTGNYDVVDGPRMQDLLSENNASVTLGSTVQQVRELGKQVDAQIVLWGELSGEKLQMRILDLRTPEAQGGQVQQVERAVKEPTDLRFAVEQVLESIQGMAAFEHPVEQQVWDDELSRRLWKEGPNLLSNGDFSMAGKWTGIYQSELYPVPLQDGMPPEDKVAIVRQAGEDGSGALVLHLSKYCAQNNGLAALSDSIKIKPERRYRLSYKYKSDAPRLFVFVKGYTLYAGPTGKMMQREIYRRQAPVLKGTDNNWVTIVDDFSPQHVSLAVQELRVDFYTYLNPGIVVIDDAVFKEVGALTRKGKDDAIKPTTTPAPAPSRPAGTK